MTFGGVKAVDGVNVRVGPGQRLAIVGANGAGKTTLFNALTGFVPPTTGTVHLGDLDITGMPAYARIRQGIGRTFQLPRLADILTVRQNILAGQAQSADLIPRAQWLMERFGIAALADIPIQVVPFGTRRKVEIVRSLARRPEVLLIDEPVSGLEDEEVSGRSSRIEVGIRDGSNGLDRERDAPLQGEWKLRPHGHRLRAGWQALHDLRFPQVCRIDEDGTNLTTFYEFATLGDPTSLGGMRVLGNDLYFSAAEGLFRKDVLRSLGNGRIGDGRDARPRRRDDGLPEPAT